MYVPHADDARHRPGATGARRHGSVGKLTNVRQLGWVFAGMEDEAATFGNPCRQVHLAQRLGRKNGFVTAPSAQLPLCFVLMPFGVKADGAGRRIDFDSIYRDGIQPAVGDARMEPLRADEERDGGIVHKPMLERLVLCSFAVADLTLANANVFYELGVRHAVRPYTT